MGTAQIFNDLEFVPNAMKLPLGLKQAVRMG
jgi:hypothetical protein